MDLSILNVVRPGDKLELYYINNQNKDIILKTIVYDVNSEDEILIHNPLKDGKLYIIPMNVEVSVICKREDYGVVAFRVLLVKRVKQGNIYTIECKVVSELKKQQRRFFFRVKLYRDIVIRYLVDKEEKQVDYYIFDPDVDEKKEIEISVSTLDISGGGLGFRSKVYFDIGTYIYTTVDFFENPVEIHGTVVRCFSSQKYDGEFEIGMTFEDVPSEVTRMIASFVFASQQKARGKVKKKGEE